MSKRERDTRRMLILGGFLVVGLVALTFLTFRLGNLTLAPRTSWTVHFGEHSMVRKGYDVWVAGTKVGTVEDVKLAPDSELAEGRYVIVRISLPEDLVLWEGAEVIVRSVGLLGRAQVDLARGKPRGQQLPAGTALRGRVDSGLFSALEEVVAENRENINEMTGNLAATTRSLREGHGTIGRLLSDDEVYQDIRRITESLAEVAQTLNSDQSSIGRLLRNPDVYDDVSAFMGNLRAISEDIRAGKGTFGQLLVDDSLARNLTRTTESLQRIADRLDRGEGTLGKLLKEDAMYDDLAASIKSLRRVADQLAANEGTLGKLLSDGEVYENLRRATGDLRRIVEDLRAGKGTVGKLLKDDSVYKELEAMLQGFREAGEIARENAPLSSLVSFTSLRFNVLN